MGCQMLSQGVPLWVLFGVCKNLHGCRYVDPAAANSSLAATLHQLYGADESGNPSAGAPGHIMYSDQPPLVDPLGDEGALGSAFTQGRGVMVRMFDSNP